jgi:Uncharacterized protein conserved in bacteria
MASSPVFYLKINLNTDFAVACFQHWTRIVEACGADYYIVCDNEALKNRVIHERNKDRFIPSSVKARRLLRHIVVSHWLNAGAALLTPFLHAREKGYRSFWNIDADDTVMCAEAMRCADMLRQVQEHADRSDVDCFSLDMHSSAFERFYPYWTFGVCYCKTDMDYVSKLLGFNDFFDRLGLKRDDLFDNNLDEVFSILGKHSQIRTGTFYIENLVFRHSDFAIHYCKDGRFHYRNVSQFTKALWRLKDEEIRNGLPIPERFVKFDFGLSLEESLAFLESRPVFHQFEGRQILDLPLDFISEKIREGKKKLVLFGAGKDGLRALNTLRAYEIEPHAFCDNSANMTGKEVQGVKVISFGQLKALSLEEEVLVLITTSRFYYEVRKQLSSIPVQVLNPFSAASLHIRKHFARTFKLFVHNQQTPIYLWGDYRWFVDINNFYKDILKYDLLADIQGFIESEDLPQECKEQFSCIPLDELPEDAFVVISTEAPSYLEKQREMLRRGKINNYHFILGFELEFAFKRVLYSSTRRFQNYYNGGRCFIIGNGPSLTLEDLETLRKNNEVVFVSNNFYRWFDRTALRPDFYFIWDVLDVQAENVLQNEQMNFMVPIHFRSEMLKKVQHVYFFEISPWVQYDYYPYKPFFSEDLPLVYEAGSISYIMLQMAVNMGFTEIYFLGMDNDFPIVVKHDGSVIIDEKVQHHFYDQKLRLTTYNKDMFEAEYAYARDYCKQKGVHIYNATRGGKLEVFERVDFDRLFPAEDK